MWDKHQGLVWSRLKCVCGGYMSLGEKVVGQEWGFGSNPASKELLQARAVPQDDSLPLPQRLPSTSPVGWPFFAS